MQTLKLPQKIHDHVSGLIRRAKENDQRVYGHVECTLVSPMEDYPWSWIRFRIQNTAIDLIWEWNKTKAETYIYDLDTKELLDMFHSIEYDPRPDPRGAKLSTVTLPEGNFSRSVSNVQICGWNLRLSLYTL